MLYFDLSRTQELECDKVIVTNYTRLRTKLSKILATFKDDHKLSYPKEVNSMDEFSNISKEMKRKGKMTVVITDEYDFPGLANVKECSVAEMMNKKTGRPLLST